MDDQRWGNVNSKRTLRISETTFTSQSTQATWRMVFIISALIWVAGGIIYTLLVPAEVQKWNDLPPKEINNDKIEKSGQLMR